MKKLTTILILAVIAGSAFCKTITVTSSADSGVGTLRQAVLDAEDNDIIVFEDNIREVYQTSFIRLEKSITILANKNNPVTIIASNVRHFLIPDMAGIANPVTASFNNLIFKNAYYTTCGGSIYNRKGNTLTLNNCVFINNSAGEIAGAIDNAGTLTINNCVFNSNICVSTGVGAVQNGGKMYINNTIFTNNKVNKINTPSSYGPSSGAVYNNNNGILIITNSLFLGNQGDPSGGVINRGVAYILNCLFVENSSSSLKNTGTIFNFKFGTSDIKETSLTIVNSTIVGNIGEGIYNSQKVNLYNNIVFNNAANDIYNDSIGIITLENNLIGTSNTDLSGNNNIIGEDPLFVGNGDYSLQSISSAINAGNNGFLSDTISIDLAMKKRISDNIIDLGAYEYQIPTSVRLNNETSPKIYSLGHSIYIENVTSAVSIYNLMGQAISHGRSSTFQVPAAGVYIVHTDNAIQKIIVK